MLRHVGTAMAIAVVIYGGSCAGGGPSGTHFSTAQGNLSNATASRTNPAERPTTALAQLGRLLDFVGRAWAQNGIEGVRVSVEGTEFAAFTDAGGSFVVRGDFAGPLTLLFERDDGLSARIGIEVPAGGTVTLRNVSCSGSSGACEAEDVDVDEPSDDDVSGPSVDDPSDPPVPSPPDESEAEDEPSSGDLESNEGTGDGDAVSAAEHAESTADGSDETAGDEEPSVEPDES